ncbi:hypothetical protein GJ496_000397 [Pomphorhynchus laevis]|nr:hypothetical protein GJ496_000397 [Pomphorhynchus laevis]
MEITQSQAGGENLITSFLEDTFSGKIDRNTNKRLSALNVTKDYFHETIKFKDYNETWGQSQISEAENADNSKNISEINVETFSEGNGTALPNNDLIITNSLNPKKSQIDVDHAAFDESTDLTIETHTTFKDKECEHNLKPDLEVINSVQTHNQTIKIDNNLQIKNSVDISVPQNSELSDAQKQQSVQRADKLCLDKNKPNKIVGLINNGTNCHANSVIQCLLRCESIRSWVMGIPIDKCYRPNPRDFCCFCSLRHVFRCFETEKHPFPGAKGLVRGLTITTRVNFSGQSDASEFALLLLDKLVEHYSKFHRSAFTNNASKLDSSLITKRTPGYFSDLYTLKIKHISKCQNCKDCSSIIESHPIVHLNLFGKTALYSQLQNFIRQNRPRQKCTKCHRFRQQWSYIIHCPHVLIFAIPRVNSSLLKTKQSFIYGNHISLTATKFPPAPVLSNSRAPIKPKLVKKLVESRYNLCTIVIHSGTQSSGHYSVLVRSNSPSGWSTISDSVFRSVSASEVYCRDDATLLFYIDSNEDNIVNMNTKAAKSVPEKHPSIQTISKANQSNCGQNGNSEDVLPIKSTSLATCNISRNDVKLEESSCIDVKKDHLTAHNPHDEENEIKDNHSDHVDSVDLSLPVSENALFQMGKGRQQDPTENDNEDDEFDYLCTPKKRKRAKNTNLLNVNKSFHEYVH